MSAPRKPAVINGGCVHHWTCPEPDGPVAHSRCKKCGLEKDFRNYVASELGEYYTVHAQRRWRQGRIEL